MADSKMKHSNEKEAQLIEALDRNSDILVGKFKDLKKQANDIQRTFHDAFHGAQEDVEKMLKTSKSLQELYERIGEDMENITSLINEAGEEVGKLAETYQTSNQEIVKILDLLHQYEEKQQRINDLTDKLNNTTVVEEQERINAALIDENILLDEITRKLNSSAVSAKMFQEYQNGTNAELKKTVEYQEQIAKSTAQTKANSKHYKENLQSGNEQLKSTSKTMKFITSALDYGGQLLKKGWGKLVEIQTLSRDIGRTAGMSSTQIKAFEKNMLTNYGNMANRLGMTTKDIVKFQETYMTNVGRTVSLTNEQVESMAGLSKFTGAEAVNKMGQSIDELGGSADTAVGYLTLSMAKAANQGLNIQQTSEKFAKNIKMASTYTFSKGVDGISKMTLLSQRLKFNMESIGTAIDKFSTIEGAISASANLQMLGGSYAAQFSNPLLAMGEAWLDAEGFTQRIVDTFASTATFNKATGQVEMSAIDKQKMRTAAQELGISYDELFNMAAQQAKIGDIQRATRSLGLSQEENDYLASVAQFDAQKQDWYLTKTNEDGKLEKIYFNDTTKNLSDELKEVQEQSDIARATFGDVHAIREQLDKFVGGKVLDTKNIEETITGVQENLAVSLAKFEKALIGWAEDGVKQGLHNNSTLSLITSLSLGVGMMGLNWVKGRFLSGMEEVIGRRQSRKKGGRTNTPSSSNQAPTNPQSKPTVKPKPTTPKGGSGVMKHGAKRSGQRAAIKMLGRNGARVAKRIPGIGTVVEVGMAAYEGVQAQNAYNEQLSMIQADTTMNREEKARAKYENRKNRNKGVGKASGAAAGAIAGAAIGSAIPVIGTVIGGLIGGAIGYWGGGKAGSAIGEAVTGSYENSKEFKELQDEKVVKDRESVEALTMIQEDVSNISARIRAIASKDSTRNQVASELSFPTQITPIPQYTTNTYFRGGNQPYIASTSMQTPMIDKIDLNINGTLKLQGVGGGQMNVDVRKLFDSYEFKRLLMEEITSHLGRNGNITQTRNLNSPQQIIGGYNSPSVDNSQIT